MWGVVPACHHIYDWRHLSWLPRDWAELHAQCYTKRETSKCGTTFTSPVLNNQPLCCLLSWAVGKYCWHLACCRLSNVVYNMNKVGVYGGVHSGGESDAVWEAVCLVAIFRVKLLADDCLPVCVDPVNTTHCTWEKVWDIVRNSLLC